MEKAPPLCSDEAFKKLAATYSPGINVQVPSALGSLTSLFGMVRGDPARNNHQRVCDRRRQLHSVALWRDPVL